MAKISLRAYLQEIERLIENKRLDEALAHCHQILEIYPKHIDTYRLFGKAYLEQQRYGDAADLFQRVLSAIPDDFISHVGMSIIREDEGNLDEALYHIQQASETQPSNAAIQEELRRLYGLRDGIEPPKIRLTRGALARMYIKGELYQQASVEIKAALAEDANRLDLQLLLAHIFIKTGKTTEAIELARAILRKLPNAYKANEILALLLADNQRETEAQPYRQMIKALNPYAAYISEEYPTTEQVPEQAVMLEKLDWVPGQKGSSISEQPAWAESLGLKLEEGKGQPEEEIPDWMRTAGWEPGSNEQSQPEEAESQPLESSIFEDDEEKIEKAELPEWLKEMAPDEDEIEPEIPAESEATTGDEEDVLPWLEKIFPSTTSASQVLGDKETDLGASHSTEAGMEEIIGEEGLPPWLSDLEQSQKPEAELAAEIPDWLSAPAEKAQTVWDETSEEEPEAELATEIPDWLSAPAEEAKTVWDETSEEEAEAELAAEIPDWLSAPADEAETVLDETTEEEPEAALAAEIPDWLSAPAEEAKTVWDETSEEEPEAALAAEIPDWLSAPADEAETVLDETTEEEPEAELAAEIPDWLSAPADEAKTAWDETVEEEPEAELAAEIPDWLSAPAEEAKAVWDETSEEEPEAELAAEIPDWLSRLDEPDISLDDTRPSKTTLARSEQIEEVEKPEPLVEQAVTEDADESLSELKFLSEDQASSLESETLPDEIASSQEDEAFTWLEGLAVRQGAEPETLLSSDQPSDTTPGWILEASEEGAEVEAVEAEPIEAEPIETEPLVAEDAQPDWQVEEIQETLVSTEGEQASETAEELVETGQVKDAITELEEMDDAFAWLESLAAKQGAEEALLLKPEERQSEAPEWVRQESLEHAGEEETEGILDISSEKPDLLELSVEQEALEEVETNIEFEDIEPISVEETLSEPQEMEPSLEKLEEDQLAEEMPELPDWLAGVESAEEEETPEWTPPARTIIPVELNQASLVELERLPGIGFRLAQEIVTYRDQHGQFSNLEQLLQVPGAEDLNLDELRAFLVLPEITEPAQEAETTRQEITFEKAASLPELEDARQALLQNDLLAGLEVYNRLIENQQAIPEIIQDLEEAVKYQPDSFDLWQTLGDAHQRAGKMREALSAYLEAEKLLR